MSKTKVAALMGAAVMLAAGVGTGVAHASAAGGTGNQGFAPPPIGTSVQLAVQPAQLSRHIDVGESVALTAVPPAPVGLLTGEAAGSLPETQIWVQSPNGQWTGTAYQAGIATENLVPPTAGTYTMIAYQLSAAQVAAGDWTAAQPSSVETVQVVGPGESQGQVAFSAAWTVPIPGGVPGAQLASVQASAPTVRDPLFQFWLKQGSGKWLSSGGFSPNPVFQFVVSGANAAAADQVAVYVIPAGEQPTPSTAPQWMRPLSADSPLLSIVTAVGVTGGAQ
jgi:hypothetical protein